MTEPFRKMHLDEDKKRLDTFTLWLNSEERVMLEDAKKILEQPKDSTAIKQLASIGAKLIGREEITFILREVYSNKRKNKRLGIVDYE